MLNWVRAILVVAGLLAYGLVAEAQQTKTVHRIGYLSPIDPTGESARSEGIRLALRELGYGRSIIRLTPDECTTRVSTYVYSDC